MSEWFSPSFLIVLEQFAPLISCVLGAACGSFVSLASFRLPRDQDIVKGRSACPKCHHFLSWHELIPVLSWLKQFGKCYECKTPISIRYPLIELVTGALFFFVYQKYGISFHTLVLWLLVVLLMILIVTDLEYLMIPDSIQMSLAALAYASWPLYGLEPLSQLGSALGLGITIWLLSKVISYWKKRDALGFGDVKLFFVSGLFLPIETIPFFLFVSGIAGVVFGCAWKVIHRDGVFPFGPAMAVSLFLCLYEPRLPFMWQESLRALFL